MDLHSAQFDTPNIRASEAILVLHASTEINAPASLVFRTLRNTETWRDWNRFVPKVNITYQPPEEDSATTAEIQQIVRNTSIIGSFYSDLTDGGSGVRRPRSPDEQPPPRFRLNSISSQMSQDSQNANPPRKSESIDPLSTNGNGAAAPRVSISSTPDSPARKSAAQKFQEAQQSRRSSMASGQEPAPIVNKIGITDNHRASLSVPQSPASPRGRRGSKNPTQSTVNSKAAEKAHQHLMSMYGEPSVRLQIKTKVTFYVRMKPYSPSEYTETNMVVTDVSRPDDPLTEKGTTALTRSKTHNLERSGMYRVIWATDSEGASLFKVGDIFRGSKMPKYLLQGERVHEIEPTGPESCVYRTWECQRGHAAKTVKKKYGEYLQKMFEVWAGGLRDFCEGLHAPRIERRDFSISADEAPVVIQTLT
ncbi:hypothetical protein PMZ80_005314 [Knufia obscura]|uniref:Uncharacterized protein n=2 Tax=Knufia TaxID=430999 RepID=A0AAN8ISA6_9EURO|nr:hypothetical protein PMZ80_005314 [Knufia obscura]KAK5957982.1 hypothetical protein OHC33_001172 [Knufia fluminis]